MEVRSIWIRGLQKVFTVGRRNMEAGTIELFGLLITIVMTCYVFKSCRHASIAERCVAGVGFFTVAFYLDLMCVLIVEGLGAAGTGRAVLGILAVVVSKSIMLSGLILGKVILSGQQGEDGPGMAGAGSGAVRSVAGMAGAGGFRTGAVRGMAGAGGYGTGEVSGRAGRAGSGADTGERGPGDGGKQGLDYMTGLTLGVTLFFMVLAMGIPGQQGSVGRRFLTAFFFLGVLLLFYSSQVVYLRKRQGERKRAEDLGRKREADVYLENVENNYQRTRELWHDLKNHINLLNILLSEHKYEQMADYLKVFGEDVDLLTLPVKSGNIIVDALLEDKVARARKEGVELRLSLCDLTGLLLKPDEICGLFGNLLDNALEANRQVQEGRFLEVDCREQTEVYYIKVKNAAEGRAKEQGGVLQTTKADRQNRVGHGLGLRSAERIVHGCGGELVVDSRERDFTVVVRLPKL